MHSLRVHHYYAAPATNLLVLSWSPKLRPNRGWVCRGMAPAQLDPMYVLLQKGPRSEFDDIAHTLDAFSYVGMTYISCVTLSMKNQSIKNKAVIFLPPLVAFIRPGRKFPKPPKCK